MPAKVSVARTGGTRMVSQRCFIPTQCRWQSPGARSRQVSATRSPASMVRLRQRGADWAPGLRHLSEASQWCAGVHYEGAFEHSAATRTGTVWAGPSASDDYLLEFVRSLGLEAELDPDGGVAFRWGEATPLRE